MFGLIFGVVYICIAIVVASFIVSEGIFDNRDTGFVGFISLLFPFIVPVYTIGLFGGKLSEYIEVKTKSRRK